MKNNLQTRLGVFFALGAIVAVIILETVGVSDYFQAGYRITADFQTIQDLKKGDLVRMAGVDIGRVENIALQGEKVRVTMKIRNREAVIRTDSKATIKFTGLLGQNFVAVDFGRNGQKADDGATLQTIEQADLSQLMARLDGVAGGIDSLTKSFTPDNLAPLFGPITDFMKANSTNLSAILANTRIATENIAQGRGTVGKLVTDDTLYNSALTAVAGLQGSTAELKPLLAQARSAVDSIQGVVAQINSGQGTLGKLTRDEALYRESVAAMTNMREILEKMNKGQGTVGQLINDQSFLKNAKVTLQKVDKATETLEDQGPLSVLGVLIGTFF